MQRGMAKAVASCCCGCGAAGCCVVRGLCFLSCFGGTMSLPSQAALMLLSVAAKNMAASSAVSKRPGSAYCLRFCVPPRPSPGTCSRAWNLPLMVMMLVNPVLLYHAALQVQRKLAARHRAAVCLHHRFHLLRPASAAAHCTCQQTARGVIFGGGGELSSVDLRK